MKIRLILILFNDIVINDVDDECMFIMFVQK